MFSDPNSCRIARWEAIREAVRVAIDNPDGALTADEILDMVDSFYGKE